MIVTLDASGILENGTFEIVAAHQRIDRRRVDIQTQSETMNKDAAHARFTA